MAAFLEGFVDEFHTHQSLNNLSPNKYLEINT